MREPFLVKAYPPNIDAIDAEFKVRGKPIIYAFGDKIYAPFSDSISPALMAHEKVHCERQIGNVKEWWDRYIADRDFRLAEEIPAHIAEFNHLCQQYPNRNQRRRHLAVIAHKLSAPLYGSLLSKHEAKTIILNGAR